MAKQAKFTIDFNDLAGSPKEHIAADGIMIIRTVKCAYADRIILAKEFLGWTVGDIIYLPDRYDAGVSPLINIWARSVDITPNMGLEKNIASYISANLIIIYRNTPVDEPESGSTLYVSEELQPASEFTTLGEKNLFWANTGKEIDAVSETEVPTYLIRMFDWVYTLHNVLTLPSVVFTLPGYINSASVHSRELGRTFSEGTLLCGNPSLNRQVTSEGTTAWTVTFRFTYRENGWNNFPRSSDNEEGVTWGPVYSKDGTQKFPYKSANFGSVVI